MSDIPKTSELSELLDTWAALDAQAKELSERAAALKDKIKVRMIETRQAMDPTDPLTDIAAGSDVVSVRLKYTETWRLDTTKLKAEAPETYVKYARKSGSFTLRKA